MPPAFEQIYKILHREANETLLVAAVQSPRWSQPSDVFSVLLILGGDIVHRALAQLVGTGITPVTFSFGKPSSTRKVNDDRLADRLKYARRLGVLCYLSLVYKCQQRELDAIGI